MTNSSHGIRKGVPVSEDVVFKNPEHVGHRGTFGEGLFVAFGLGMRQSSVSADTTHGTHSPFPWS